MFRKVCLLCCFAAFFFVSPHLSQAAEEKLAEGPWVRMPAGARPTYMGIHGGTMPVSLLVSDDGSSLLTFVGRTGNDFLEVLHRTEFQMPSFLKKAAQNSTRDALEQGTILQAGDKKISMPVIYITGLGFLRSTVDNAELLPFGFSEKPVSIEGSVRMPDSALPKRKEYRLFFQPRHLIPR
ncbi:MAG: hypothetical protein IKN64_02660 [Desulfovibrio sp.]|nr:hypothetical protein [Desulfovibrio sp.]